MDKRLLVFIIISLTLHIVVLTQLSIKGRPQIDKNKPIFVDIIKDIKDKEKSPKKPEVLANKDIDIRKKGINKEDRKQTTDRPVDKKQYSVQNKNITNKAIIQKQSKKQDNNLKVTDKSNVVVKKKDENKKPISNKKIKQNSTQKNISSSEYLPDNALEKILNPSDILSKLADKTENNNREGEDDVNIETMKFKYYSYFYKFKRLLYQVWEYPRESVYKGEEGTVRIKFSILKSGEITNIRVVESSGYPDLDDAAIVALKTMKGIPFPTSYNLNILHVDGYFAYNIQRFYIY
jgi:protein TonB